MEVSLSKETYTCGHMQREHTRHVRTDWGGGLVGKSNTQQQQQQDGRQTPDLTEKQEGAAVGRERKGKKREGDWGKVAQGRRTREERNSVIKGKKEWGEWGRGNEWRPGEWNQGLD